jgi:hypothetical protein
VVVENCVPTKEEKSKCELGELSELEKNEKSLDMA